LAVIVKGLNYIFPFGDGYVIFMELFMTLAIWSLMYTLLSVCYNKISVFIVWLSLIAVNYSINAWHANFTTYTAILSCIGLFVIISYLRKRVNLIFGILGFIIFIAGGLFRIKSQLLFIPFILLLFFVELIINRKELFPYLKRFTIIILAVFLCLTGNFLLDNIVNHSDAYLNSNNYSNARSNIFDYETKSWDEVKDKLTEIGISENDYTCVKQSLLVDTDIVNADYLTSISEITKIDTKNLFNNLLSGLSLLWYFVSGNIIISLQVLILIFIFVFWLLFSNIKRIRSIEVILCYIGSAIIAIYFASIVGRLPAYVLQSIILGDWLLILSLVGTGEIKFKLKINGLHNLMLGIVVGIAIFSGFSADKIENGKIIDSFTAKIGQVQEVVNNDDGNKYVWGTSSYNDYLEDKYRKSNKLPSNDFLKSNISDGKWVYGQGYYNDFLSNIGLINPMKSLVEDGVYYVSDKDRCDMVLTFLQEHYSSNINVKQIKIIDGIPVWKFSEG
jgi:hypothetical protein